METQRLQASALQVQEVVQPAASEEPPFHKKCTISNLVRRPPVNIEFHDLKYTVHATNGGELCVHVETVVKTHSPVAGVVRACTTLHAARLRAARTLCCHAGARGHHAGTVQ